MWSERKKKIRFYKADLIETNRELHNPGCGWYHVYTFSITSQDQQKEPFYLAEGGDNEQLVLLLMDIGAFQEQEISAGALSHVEEILRFFQENNKQMILRFVYDTEGKGAEKEPQSLSLVKRHMKQISELIRKYAEEILLLQGIFVGSWGEMHDSKFLYQRAMAELINTLYKATERRCYLAVRTPAQWRAILAYRGIEPGVEDCLTVFNDGIFGSPTDLGTYDTGNREEKGELAPWGREEELSWQNNLLKGKPNGGEALFGDPPIGYERAVEDLRQMRLSYLNSVHDSKQLQLWRKETVKERGCWQNLSGYEYIGRHLGYRFTIVDVQVLEKGQLWITIENCGFAELCVETECFLVLKAKDGNFSYQLIDTDARNWTSGQKTILYTELPQNATEERCRLFLQLKRKRDGKVIYFANDSEGKNVMLGEFR